MDMEERYRLIISSILNAIGFRVDVERMMANGRIDIIASFQTYICNRTKTEEQRRNGSCKRTKLSQTNTWNLSRQTSEK